MRVICGDAESGLSDPPSALKSFPSLKPSLSRKLGSICVFGDLRAGHGNVSESQS